MVQGKECTDRGGGKGLVPAVGVKCRLILTGVGVGISTLRRHGRLPVGA